ncbi:MAG TPA: protein translocase subunit SecD [Mycobacteriales bacterium]|nr:protein translocase subunit SecD [Mycobacteriales bacterium]
MPPSSSQLRASRYLLGLAALLVVAYVLVFFTGSSRTPKLGLDLQGGTTVTLKARTESGKTPSKDELNTSRSIIEKRVNGLGVASSEVRTEGNDQIVISIPGKNGEQAKQLGSTAQLYFRAALAAPVSATAKTGTQPSSSASDQPSDSPSSSPSDSSSASNSPSASPSDGASNSPSPQGRPLPPMAAPNDKPTPTPSDTPSSDQTQVPTGWPQSLVADIDKSCDQLAKAAADAPANKQIVVCTDDGKEKFALDKALFKGTEVSNAAAQYIPPPQGNGWSISLSLKGHGSKIWADYTSQHNKDAAPDTTPYQNPANYVGFVLDGRLLGAPPEIQGTINGDTQITGQFDADKAKTLAANFKYGALPLSFTTSEAQTISATLGTSQLKAGLLAGGIGLVLVVIYALLYYRALGVVTLCSLLISGLIVYAAIVLLGRQLGFTLTLAGIAGLIVSVGITADSFVVFFERLKEEVREGRTMRSGVPRAWVRARRTILSADAVSFLAAAVLYYLAAGEVKGFAFTLGLSTILDLVVVFLFTHPLVSVAARSRTLSSPRWSGLGGVRPVRAAAVAAGAAGSGSTAAERAARRHSSRVSKES